MRILLVEDEEKLANSLANNLRVEGFAVDVAFDGESGKNLALTYTYDIVILDVMLPGMDGSQVLKVIRTQNRDVPVLMLTARDSVQDKVKFFEAGADDYLTKPFSFAQLDGLKPPEIPVVVPSGLLERRPDIASAASKLASANANVGVAKTAYLPNVNLGLITGFQNSGSLGLLTAPNLLWSLGPSAVLNVFDGGKRDAQVKIATSKRDELASEYKLIVLKAFKDVEDSLAMLVSLNKQMVSAENTQSAVKHSNSLVMNRYFEGIVSSFEVVKANDDLLNANEVLLNIKINNLEARLALVHALGGGWVSEN